MNCFKTDFYVFSVQKQTFFFSKIDSELGALKITESISEVAWLMVTEKREGKKNSMLMFSCISTGELHAVNLLK